MPDNNYILKDLPSVVFDDKLNKELFSCEYCSYCEKNGVNLKDKPWFKFLCYQFARNLETVNDMNWIDATLNHNRCNNLIYWIYEKAKKIHVNIKTPNPMQVIGNLKFVWNDIYENSFFKTNKYKCQIPNDIYDFENLAQKKKINDYCENYTFLKNKLNESDYMCSIYYEYINNNLREYEENFSKCSSGGIDSKYCISNCNLDNNNPKNLLETSACNPTQLLQEKNDARMRIECESKKSELETELERRSALDNNPSFNFSDHRAVSLVLLSSWGIFLTILFLYKTSPLGLWIKNIVRKKEIVGTNFDEENEQELLDNYSENMNRNFKNAEYNISYNSN
ncbi:PIR Superfamily Protein [Plasmodium ovale curtisi]|uniref:PIR Superfamily Protein n=1 Tax=Plasmodium ovale curtisi TaxID=864141 RepID=A0A1A8W8F6_PLAOA|nr:PIR Superfamily Protein [Plasmodium ovale curtisi]